MNKRSGTVAFSALVATLALSSAAAAGTTTTFDGTRLNDHLRQSLVEGASSSGTASIGAFTFPLSGDAARFGTVQRGSVQITPP